MEHGRLLLLLESLALFRWLQHHLARVKTLLKQETSNFSGLVHEFQGRVRLTEGFVSFERLTELFHSVPIFLEAKQSQHLIVPYRAMLSLSHGSSQFSVARLL